MTETTLPIKLTSELVSAYVAHNPVPASDIERLIRAVHHALCALAAGELENTPAIAIKQSVTNEYLVCLEDGKRMKMLKRYLRGRYGMTPDAYRAKWKLPYDYPMVAPGYAKRRSTIAREIGLGRRLAKRRRSHRLSSEI